MTWLLTLLLLVTFGVGNLLSWSLPNSSVHIYLSDALVGLVLLVGWRKAIRSYNAYHYSLLLVMLSLLISWILGLLRFGISPAIVAGAYLVRWVSYSLFPIVIVQFVKPIKLRHLLTTISLIFTAFGLFQYLLFPDLRTIGGGWDPHYYRLVSTLLDPNFTGLLLVFILVWFYDHNWLLWSLVYIAMVLTYSRSTYLAFLTAHLFLTLSRRQWLRALLLPTLLLATVLMLPRPGGEGVRLERTSTLNLRMINWQSSFDLFASHPIFGIGFNYLRSARPDADPTSHSAAGADSSLLFVAVTTGLVGLSAYCYYLWHLYRAYPSARPILLAAVVHSLFTNSLFYPHVLLWLGLYLATCDTPHQSLSESDSQLNRLPQTPAYSRLRSAHN